MSKLGHPVVYRTHPEHGHHDEMVEFAGLIERENADGTVDVAIKVPNKPEWRTVERIIEGAGDHEFQFLRHEPAELASGRGKKPKPAA